MKKFKSMALIFVCALFAFCLSARCIEGSVSAATNTPTNASGSHDFKDAAENNVENSTSTPPSTFPDQANEETLAGYRPSEQDDDVHYHETSDTDQGGEIVPDINKDESITPPDTVFPSNQDNPGADEADSSDDPIPETESTPVVPDAAPDNEGTPTPDDFSDNSANNSADAEDSTGDSAGNSGSDADNSGSDSTEAGAASGNAPGSADSDQNNAGSNITSPDTVTHNHKWTPVYQIVQHSEVGHFETVVIEAAWEEPVYEHMNVCSACGETFSSSRDAADHTLLAHGGLAAYYNKKIQIGSIYHAAVTEDIWVVDQDAFEETVLTGYKCSGCGETNPA